jgi:hypothetical protein
MVAANTKYSFTTQMPPGPNTPPGGQKSHNFPLAGDVVKTSFHIQESRYNV